MTDRKAWEGHTPGPWSWEREQDEWPDHMLVGGNGDPVLQWDMDCGFSFASDADEALIAAAPSLAARVEELEAERDRLRGALELLLQALDGPPQRIVEAKVIESLGVGPIFLARAALKRDGDK